MAKPELRDDGVTVGKPLTIVVEPSDYILRNAGDMAMMQVALTRLAARWPDAEIAVFSDVPDRLPPFAPNVRTVDARGRRVWLHTPVVATRLVARRLRRVIDRDARDRGASQHTPAVPTRQVARRLRRVIDRVSRWMRIRVPRIALAAIVWRLDPDDRRLVRAHVALLARADLVIATGMGGITDVFPRYAGELLETMAAAQRGGAATAMVGQGLGPIDDPRLLNDAAKVLRNLDLIALREDRAGRPLLQRLGVPTDRMLTTGDDAIELAIDRVPAHMELGRAIGVNVRLSDYSALTAAAAVSVARAVEAAGTQLGVPLQPIAISAVPGEEDATALAGLFDAVEDVGALEVPTLHDVLAATARCRVVVTGSYHAAVFALSIGVPAIGLAASRYYEDKFLGLAQQFGEGCDVVMLGGRGVDDLAGTIVGAWARAPALRTSLRDAGVRQVALGYEAFDRVAALVDSRSDLPAPVSVSS